MKVKDFKRQLLLNRIPVLGILIFVLLFYFSSFLYPGGSQSNPDSIGFDWINNYWCNLMRKNGMNGAANPARPFAIFAMLSLCTGVGVFFYQFADFFTSSKIWKMLTKSCGILSMLFATLMFSTYHDEMTLISSAFGLIATIGVIRAVYRSNLNFHKWLGLLCLLLLAINNFIYYSQELIEWLPLIQKITFVLVLVWILIVNKESKRIIKSHL